MGSTPALYTGLTGLTVNSRQLDVIGNNIANVNTTAYKSNRLITAPSAYRNFSLGTGPGTNTGGTNPFQTGLGASVSGTQRNHSNGGVQGTGVVTDLAIEGDGFFIVNRGGEQLYTRSGAFQRNELNELTTIAGDRVRGYAVDSQFNVIEGTLVDLSIPVGTLTIAEASRDVVLSGNLNASGDIPTRGAEHISRAFFTDPALTPGNEAVGTLDLTTGATSLYIDDGAGGSFLAIEGGSNAIVTFAGAEKGGKDMGTRTFAFTDAATAATLGVDAYGATVDDYMAFLDNVLGLSSDVLPPSNNDLGGGVAINANGEIVITGNEGVAQDLSIETADLTVTYPTGFPIDPLAINQAFVMNKTATADGESVRTSFVVYDSLGTPVTVDLSMVLQETISGVGTRWEFIAESNENSAPDSDRIVGLGILEFDSNGKFTGSTNQSFSIFRDNGAVSPMTVAMDFNGGNDAITSLTDTGSNLAAIFQDGSSIGTLTAFAVGNDGIISGSFSNGLTRDIGQVAIARFTNPGGLIDDGSNLFRVGPNSGAAITALPLEFGAGRIIGGALELSNVDLSQEFINMILASTGYSAASRVVTTTNEMIDQLLVLGA